MVNNQKIKFAKTIFLSSMILLGLTLASGKMWDTTPVSSYSLSNGNITDHIWSPDGTQIAYITCPDSHYWGCELWVADWNLENSELIHAGVDWNELYDWKGEWLLIGLNPVETRVLTDGKATYGELWKIKSDGTELTRITDTYNEPAIRTSYNPAYYNMGSAGWAKFIPDTNLVYFSAHNGNGWWGAHTTTDDGTFDWLRIHNSFSFTIGMCPGGERLLWGSSWYWNQPTRMYSSSFDGTDIKFMYSFPVKTWPLVLGDCNTVILSWPSGGIRAIDMDGTNLRDVAVDEYYNHWGDYHPLDDNAFLMTSNRGSDGNYHIFKINSDGTGIVQLSDGLYHDSAPLYSPDGKYISYTRLSSEINYEAPGGYALPYELVVIDMAATQIDSLISDVGVLKDAEILNKGQANSFVVKLETAYKQYFRSHYDASVNVLNALINQVYDFMDCGVLTEEQGMMVINKVNDIIDLIDS